MRTIFVELYDDEVAKRLPLYLYDLKDSFITKREQTEKTQATAQSAEGQEDAISELKAVALKLEEAMRRLNAMPSGESKEVESALVTALRAKLVELQRLIAAGKLAAPFVASLASLDRFSELSEEKQEEVKRTIRSELGAEFDAMMVKREESLQQLEERVKKLRSELEGQEERKNEVIDAILVLVENGSAKEAIQSLVRGWRQSENP